MLGINFHDIFFFNSFHACLWDMSGSLPYTDNTRYDSHSTNGTTRRGTSPLGNKSIVPLPLGSKKDKTTITQGNKEYSVPI